MAKVRFVFGVLISLLFLHLAIKNVDFGTVAKSLRIIDIQYVFICVFFQFANLFCRSYLWKNILSFEKNVQYRHSFQALIIGYMGNNILPFRMGEAMRAYAIGRKEHISLTLAFASIILERLFDLCTLLLLFFMLVFLVRLEKWIVLSGIVVSLLLVLVTLLLYAFASDFLRLPSTLYRYVIKYMPGVFIGTAGNIASSFVKGIKLIRSLSQFLWLAFLSLCMWILWTCIVYFGFKAFHLNLPITAALLLTVVVHIGVMIPSSPGFIGVFQYLCIVSLSFFSVPKEIALTFSILIHSIQYILTTTLGWLYLTQLQVASYQALKKEFENADV